MSSIPLFELAIVNFQKATIGNSIVDKGGDSILERSGRTAVCLKWTAEPQPPSLTGVAMFASSAGRDPFYFPEYDHVSSSQNSNS